MKANKKLQHQLSYILRKAKLESEQEDDLQESVQQTIDWLHYQGKEVKDILVLVRWHNGTSDIITTVITPDAITMLEMAKHRIVTGLLDDADTRGNLL